MPKTVSFVKEMSLVVQTKKVITIRNLMKGEKLIVNSYNLKGINVNSYKIKIPSASKMEDVFSLIFG